MSAANVAVVDDSIDSLDLFGVDDDIDNTVVAEVTTNFNLFEIEDSPPKKTGPLTRSKARQRQRQRKRAPLLPSPITSIDNVIAAGDIDLFEIDDTDGTVVERYDLFGIDCDDGSDLHSIPPLPAEEEDTLAKQVADAEKEGFIALKKTKVKKNTTSPSSTTTKKTPPKKARPQQKTATLPSLQAQCKPIDKAPAKPIITEIDELHANTFVKTSKKVAARQAMIRELQFGTTSVDFKEHLRRIREDEQSNWTRLQTLVDGCIYGEVPKTSQSSSSTSSTATSSSSSSSTASTAHAPRRKTISSLLNTVPMGVWSAPMQDQLAYVDTIYQQIAKTLDIPKKKDPRVIEACPRAHAHIMMSERYGSRIRDCRAKAACLSLHLFGFIMREYLSPSEYAAFTSDGCREYPSTIANYCYIDLLMMVLHQYAGNTLQKDGMPTTIDLPFYHITDKLGEYKQSAMIQPKSMSHVNTHIGPQVFRSELPHSTAETTHGLTLPVRCFSMPHFVKEIRVIRTPLGDIKNVNGLHEVSSIIFNQHETVVTPPLQVRPYKYMHPETTYIPGTADILIFLFSRENLDHNVGYRRLQQYGRIIDPDTNYMTPLASNHLMYYWCNVYAFPWRYFFCPDIRETVAHLRTILDVARIDIKALLEVSPDLDSFFIDTPSEEGGGVYSKALDDPRFSHIHYYIALRLRTAMLQSLLAVYPDSKNTIKDVTMHTRFDILLQWNCLHYERYLYNDVDGQVRFDENVDPQVIDDACKQSIPYHLYSSDYQLYKYRMVMIEEATPRQEVRRFVPAHLRWLFVKFDKLRRQFDRHFHITGKSYFNFEQLCDNGKGRGAVKISRTLPYVQGRIDDVFKRRGHSIYAAALLRINIASYLHARTLSSIDKCVKSMTDMRANLDMAKQYHRLENYLAHLRRRRYNLRLFVYTHLDLMQRFYDLNDFTDRVMLSRSRHPNVNYCLRNYDEVTPYDTRMFHEGMLPNLSTMIYCVPFPCTPMAAGADSTATATISQLHSVMRMLNFFMQRICHARVNIKQHLKLCIENTAYRKLVSMVLELCMLGAYQHADHMPTFDQAVEFHRLFANAFNSQKFLQWQEHHAALTMLAMREFTVFQIKLCTPYHYFLIASYPWWISHCRQIFALTNIMRMSCASGNALFSIQHAIQNISKLLSRTNISPTILQHIDKYSADITDFNHLPEHVPRENNVNIVYSLCQQLSAFNTLFARQHIERQRMPLPIISAIERFVALFPRHTKVDPQWLMTFNFGLDEEHPDANMHQSTVEIIKCIFNFIERGKLELIKDALLAIPRRDYEIVDAYFFNVLTHNCVTVYELSQELKEQQIAAIHKRYDLTEGSVFAPGIYTLMLAQCCGTVKSYITADATPHSYGSETVGLNTTENVLVCKRRDPLSNTQKQSYRVATQLDNRFTCYLKNDDEHNAAKLCRRLIDSGITPAQRRFFMQKKCEETPITFIPLVGYVVEVTSSQILRTINVEPTTNAFSVCTTCGGVMAFSTRMFGTNGLSCNECSIAHTKELYTPDCMAKYHKVKFDWRHPYFVVDDLPDVGTQEFGWRYVCDHCYKRKTAGYSLFPYMLTSTCARDCKHFAKNRRQLDLDFITGSPVNELFNVDTSTSAHALKMYAAAYTSSSSAAAMKRRRQQ